jgi:large subunit ribosomal protein L29
MKVQAIRAKSGEELDKEQANLRKELFDLRFQSSSEQIDSPSRIGQIRRTLARILTVQRERSLEAARTEKS